jgi:hypothetical protein
MTTLDVLTIELFSETFRKYTPFSTPLKESCTCTPKEEDQKTIMDFVTKNSKCDFFITKALKSPTLDSYQLCPYKNKKDKLTINTILLD